MKVPLSVQAVEKRNKEYLEIWYNGKQVTVPSPINPYYYSYRKDLPVTAKVEPVGGIALSDFKKKTFYKYSFQTRNQLVRARSNLTYEDNIPFVIRNRIDNPDVFKRFAHTNELKFLFLDIEQDCPEGKPFPDYTDIVTSISWCTNDRVIKSAYLKKENMKDKKLLEVFIKQWKNISPDIVVAYNKGYDLPTLFNRCKKNRISVSHFSKSNKPPYVGGKDNIHIDGTVIYDVYESVKADQSLTGKIPNRKLKTVSNWFGFKEERKPLTPEQITAMKGEKELVDYNKDDIRRLLLLFDIYWQNIEFNANDLRIPLNEAIQMKTSDLGLITLGDAHRELGVISDGTNYQRYPEIFQRDKDKDEKNYQGALVDIFQVGLFKPVYKADYSSMYPMIMATFNLSPDTTTLLEYRPYSGKFEIDDRGSWFVYNIPDSTLNKDMVIQVSKKPGFSSMLVKRYLDERSGYKKKWKQTKIVKYRALSDNRKLKANGGVYGNMGYSKHPYGFAPIAVATCGIGRECGQLLIDLLNSMYPNSVIEVDTDGVYFSTDMKVDKKKIIETFDKMLFDKFQKELDLSIDIDDYERGYFYKAKNYILRTLEGKKILHGVALTSSSHTPMKKNLIDEISDAKLKGEDTKPIINRYMALDFPLTDFALNVKLGMPISKYKNQNSIACRMALVAQERFGQKPEVGNQYYYIKSKGGYKLFDVSTKGDIDYDYYQDDIRKVIEIFSIDNPASTLEEWI